MTSPIEPGTPVTVAYSAEYRWLHSDIADHERHYLRDERGRLYSAPADAFIVAASDGTDPDALTPAIRSVAHRAAREAGEYATTGQAVEAALSALEPVVAGLVEKAKNAATEEGR